MSENLMPFDEFMEALPCCDTVKVILTGCGESVFETKPIYEGICKLANRRAEPENEPIVRCGECIHFEPYDGEEYKGNCNELVGLDSCMYEDDYCSYGERKPERS